LEVLATSSILNVQAVISGGSISRGESLGWHAMHWLRFVPFATSEGLAGSSITIEACFVGLSINCESF
jgi:hypothetical protein